MPADLPVEAAAADGRLTNTGAFGIWFADYRNGTFIAESGVSMPIYAPVQIPNDSHRLEQHEDAVDDIDLVPAMESVMTE